MDNEAVIDPLKTLAVGVVILAAGSECSYHYKPNTDFKFFSTDAYEICPAPTHDYRCMKMGPVVLPRRLHVPSRKRKDGIGTFHDDSDLAVNCPPSTLCEPGDPMNRLDRTDGGYCFIYEGGENVVRVPCDGRHAWYWAGYAAGQERMRQICLEGVDKAIRALHGEKP